MDVDVEKGSTGTISTAGRTVVFICHGGWNSLLQPYRLANAKRGNEQCPRASYRAGQSVGWKKLDEEHG